MTRFWKNLLAGTLCGAMACAALAGCGAKEEATAVDLKLSGMRTEFAYGEAFSSSGLAVTIVYSDDTERRANSRNYTVDSSKYRADTPGDYEITVTCKELSKGYTVTVKAAASSDDTEKKEDALKWYEDGVLSVLMIGNSWADDTAQYVYDIAKDRGVKVSLGVLYIGSCSIAMHYNNLKEDLAVYEYRVVSDETGGRLITTKNFKMRDAITSQHWDFITYQSGSGDGYNNCVNLASYAKLGPLMDMVAELANDDVQWGYLLGWAFPTSNTGPLMQDYGGDQLALLAAVTDTVRQATAQNGIEIILPVGTAIQNARTSFLGDTLNRDESHLTYGLGRYIAGLTMFMKLTGISVKDVTFRPTGTYAVSEEEQRVAVEAATNAVQYPFEVIQSQYKS